MSYESISSSTRRARKEHLCLWCHKMILKGEVYAWCVGKYEGNFQTAHYHPKCDEEIDIVAKAEGRDFSFEPGEGSWPETREVLECIREKNEKENTKQTSINNHS